ncbi:MAG TPA: hypothetical protein VM597_37860 [Gemmataceae bacterium]|jgi:hypothetical protein|nr:hypothetical protein [Gemmataceae bacterium]
MLHNTAVLVGAFAGFVIPVVVALLAPGDWYLGSGFWPQAWKLVLAALFLAGPAAGGYLADRLVNKTRRYDPDYDDRPPTDPA